MSISADAPSRFSNLEQHYQALVTAGSLEADPAQAQLVARLHDLILASQLRDGPSASGLGRWFGRKSKREPAQGLYIHGKVGRGKTMLMDLFFAHAPLQRKRRVHFHAFMLDVHQRLHDERQQVERRVGDPILHVAQALASETDLLCFDEFSVTDIADAMILARLFGALWHNGVVVVATSNVAPADLYRDGLNRALFLPFITLLQQHMAVHDLAAQGDYRLSKLGRNGVYFSPLDFASQQAMDAVWRSVCGSQVEQRVQLPVASRSLLVPRSAGPAARFDFDALFRQPLAAQDYLALAQQYRIILVDGVPLLPQAMRNELKRFITAIDVFYEKHIMVVISAAAPVEQLAEGAEGKEAFEFDRTCSRLIEMRSDSYLAASQALSQR